MLKSRYWGDVGIVLGGMITAQFIPLIGSLVIARVYGPAEFGVYAIWWGYVSIVSVVITGRMEQAFGLEELGPARFRLAAAAILLTLFVSISATLLLGFFVFAGFISIPMPSLMVMLLVPSGLFVALSQIWQSLAACDGKFKDLSGLRITQALSVTLLQIVAGLIDPTAAQLALSHSLGALLAVLWALRYVPMEKNYFPTSFSDAVRSVREVSSRYRRFPIYALPADAINTAAGQLPLILLQSRFGSDVAGWTALALRIFGAPIALLGGAVRDVFKNSSSKAFISRGECETEYWHTFKALAVCSAVGVPLFMIISEPLFSFGYGENWRMAGTICVWLTPMFAMRFISSPLSYTLYLAQKQKYDLAWQTALLVFTWSAFTLPASYKSALLIYSMGYGLLYGVYCVMSHRFSKGKKTL